MRTAIRLIIAVISLSFVATFAAAPAALYSKSILATFSEQRSSKDLDNQHRPRVIHHTKGIYISANGRMFMQTSREAFASKRPQAVNSKAASHSADGTVIKTSNSVAARGRQVSMTGRSIVETVKFESGARRVEIKFDEGFAHALHVVYGKEGDTPIVGGG